MVQRIAVLVCGLLLIGGRAASAQVLAWEDRGFVTVSGGGPSKEHEITTAFKFPLFGETGNVATQQTHKAGGFLDLSGGWRVWRNVAVGLSFMKRSANVDGTLTASLPDPIAFDLPRTLSGTLTSLERRERWVGVPITYVIPATDKIDVMVFGGPVVATLTQEFVVGVSTAEGPSGPTVTPARESVKKSFWGFQLGADVRYLITKQLGAGVFLRVQKASGDLTSTDEADLGGFQMGAGLRVRF
jgi:hypothetical protein